MRTARRRPIHGRAAPREDRVAVVQAGRIAVLKSMFMFRDPAVQGRRVRGIQLRIERV